MHNPLLERYFWQEPCQTTSLEQVVRNMYKLGVSWQQSADDDAAEVAYRLVIEIKDANPAFNSAEFVFAATNLAAILSGKRQYLEAEHLYLKATTAALEFFGMQHATFAGTLRNYAHFLRRTDLPFEAESLEQQAEDVFAQSFNVLANNLLIDEEQNDEGQSLHTQSHLNKRRWKKMRAANA